MLRTQVSWRLFSLYQCQCHVLIVLSFSALLHVHSWKFNACLLTLSILHRCSPVCCWCFLLDRGWWRRHGNKIRKHAGSPGSRIFLNYNWRALHENETAQMRCGVLRFYIVGKKSPSVGQFLQSGSGRQQQVWYVDYLIRSFPKCNHACQLSLPELLSLLETFRSLTLPLAGSETLAKWLNKTLQDRL